MSDPRLFGTAVARNRDVILATLRPILPASGLVLEIASGSGEHVVHFAAALPALLFQPSDRDPAARANIDAWAAQSGLHTIRPAIALDAASEHWPIDQADAMLCINMIHISPWAATAGLLRHAARLLPPGGPLVLYGPFDRDGTPLAPSNAAFDADLRARDPSWGLRHLRAVTALATAFAPPEITEMPANNLVVTYRKAV